MLLDFGFWFFSFILSRLDALLPRWHIFPAFYSAVEDIVAKSYLFNANFPVNEAWQLLRYWINMELILLALAFYLWVVNIIIGVFSHSGDHL